MKKQYKEKLNLTLDPGLKEYLKIKAIKENTTVSAIITKIIEDIIKKDKEKK